VLVHKHSRKQLLRKLERESTIRDSTPEDPTLHISSEIEIIEPLNYEI
jgi:hypothetical protein